MRLRTVITVLGVATTGVIAAAVTRAVVSHRASDSEAPMYVRTGGRPLGLPDPRPTVTPADLAGSPTDSDPFTLREADAEDTHGFQEAAASAKTSAQPVAAKLTFTSLSAWAITPSLALSTRVSPFDVPASGDAGAAEDSTSNRLRKACTGFLDKATPDSLVGLVPIEAQKPYAPSAPPGQQRVDADAWNDESLSEAPSAVPVPADNSTANHH